MNPAQRVKQEQACHDLPGVIVDAERGGKRLGTERAARPPGRETEQGA